MTAEIYAAERLKSPVSRRLRQGIPRSKSLSHVAWRSTETVPERWRSSTGLQTSASLLALPTMLHFRKLKDTSRQILKS